MVVHLVRESGAGCAACAAGTVYHFWVYDGIVEQQVERLEAGVILAYDRYHRED
jgi:hypothetical protein